MAPRMKPYIKTVLYGAATLILLAAIALFGGAMHNFETLGTSYFRAQRFLMFFSFILLGFAVCVRRKKTLAADTWFAGVLGGILLLSCLVMFFLYGGLADNSLSEDARVAANVTLIEYTVCFTAFWVRTAVLAFSQRQGTATVRRLIGGAVLVIAAAAILLFSCGQASFVGQEEISKAQALESQSV